MKKKSKKKGKKPKVLTPRQKMLKKIERIKKHLKKAKGDKQSLHKLKQFESQARAKRGK